MKEENGKKKTSAENPKRDYFWVIIVAGIIVTIAGSYFLGKFIAKQFIGAKSRVQEVQEGARSNELPIGEMPEDTGDSRDQRKRTTGGSQSESQAQIVTETSDAGASTGTEIQIEKTGDDNGVEQTGPAPGGAAQPAKTVPKFIENDSNDDELVVETHPTTKPGAQSQGAQQQDGGKFVYVLQLGMYNSLDNAMKLKKTLEDEYKMEVYVGKIDDNGQTRYRVQIGAFSKRENAQKLAKELQSKGYTSYISEIPSRE